jgi:hypothetical protein
MARELKVSELSSPTGVISIAPGQAFDCSSSKSSIKLPVGTESQQGTPSGSGLRFDLDKKEITSYGQSWNKFKNKVERDFDKIVKAGLVLHLDASNVDSYPAAGNIWYDLSRSKIDGTLFNGINYNTTDNITSFSLDGVDDYVQTTLTGTFPQISFDFWGFFDDVNLNTRLRNESAFGDWINARIHFGTRWSVGMHWNVNNSWVEIPATSLKFGWNHYSLIWNANTTQKLVYINNMLASTESTNGNIILGDFKIGVATNLNAFYRGRLSNFKVYNRALTAQEIQQNFNALRNRYGV